MAAQKIKKGDHVIVLTGRDRGKHGEVIEVPAAPVEDLVDTTGAGDLYASGFLHGFSRGADLEACGWLGSRAASEVISHLGARPEADMAAMATEVLSR